MQCLPFFSALNLDTSRFRKPVELKHKYSVLIPEPTSTVLYRFQEAWKKKPSQTKKLLKPSVHFSPKENRFADETVQVLLPQNLTSCYLHLPVMPLGAGGCNCGLCDCCVVDWRHSCYTQATGAKLELWYDSKVHIQRGKNTVTSHLVPEILLSMVCLFPVEERKKARKKEKKGKKMLFFDHLCMFQS